MTEPTNELSTTTSTPSRDWLGQVPGDWNAWVSLEQEANESPQARKSLQDWLASHGSDDHARQGLGRFAAGDPAVALTHLEAAGGDLCSLLAGRAHLWDGDHAKAREAWSGLTGSAAVGVPASLWLLEDLMRAGDEDAMAAPLEGLKSLRASAADLSYAEGLVAAARGDYDGAVAHWRLALQHDVTQAAARFRLAHRLDLQGLEAESMELYEYFTGDDVQPHVGALMNLGILYEDRDDFRNALRVYRMVTECDPTNRRARRYLADAEASVDQYYDETRERNVDKQNAVLRIPVTDFELSVRARNCLQRMNIHTLGDLVARTESELLAFKNFGETSLQEVKDILGMKGLRLGMMPAPPLSSESSGQPAPEAPSNDGDVNSLRIAELDLSVRSRAALATLGIATLGDLMRTNEATLLSCKNFGQTSLDEIRSKLQGLGLDLIR
jgi:DNA-directed RNA polymerase subunit alpha